MMIFTMNVFATGFGQFSFKAEDKKVREVLDIIEQNSNYRFFYNDEFESIDKVVNLKVESENINQVLDKLLATSDYTYSLFENNLIVISLKNNVREQSNLQQNIVRGTVKDEEGNPIPGVTIVLKGTTLGTTTDINGNYIINVVDPQSVLVFSFMGYVNQEITVGSRTQIDISLTEEVVGLEEVVVIGYGTRSKALNTAAISSFRSEDLNLKSATKQLGDMLQGMSSGVMVRNVAGAPGAESIIRIRGMNSILGSNAALVVVDGLQHGSLSNMNPLDIESIDVLKGAEATAIYGSEGANGVIVVTTKRGSNQRPKISVGSDLTFSKVSKKLPLISAADWCRYVNAIEMASNLYMDPVPIFTESEIQEYERTGGIDWQDVIMRTGVSQNHNIAVDGGSDATNYRISGSFFNNEGIIVNSHYKRYTLQAKINTRITNWFDLGLNWDGGNEVINTVYTNKQTDNPVHGALGVPPIFPIYDEEGNYFGLDDASKTKWSRYAPSFSLGNPLASAKEVDAINEVLNNNILGFLVFS